MAGPDVFISYRRDGGEFTAKMLRDRLTEQGYQVFFDVETLRSGNFNTKLYEAIDQCQDFLLVLSPGALDRCVHADDWVRREVEYALMKGKNVVPILLRGFEFPDNLPESLQALPYRNGIEANSQFFDAFMEKLQEFLQSEPPLSRKITQNTVFRRTLPLLLALAILAALAMGVGAVMDSWNAVYPRTAAEQNLTREAIYYVGRNLTYFDILADAKADATAAAKRYLQTGELSELNDAMERSLHTLSTTDLSSAAASDGLLEQLRNSPFDVAEFTAIYQELVQFRQSCLENVEYLRLLVTPEFLLSGSQKLEAIGYYEDYLNNELQAYAAAANRMLLPITDAEALALFRDDILPELERIPLRAANWNSDAAALEAVIDECANNMENALHNLETILGNSNMDLFREKEKLTQAYEAMGYTREEAQAMVELVIQGFTDGRPEYIVVLGAMGYSQDQALAVYDYVQQGFTIDRARALVDYESMDLEAERDRYADYYVSIGATEAEAADLAGKKMDILARKHELRLRFSGLTTDSEGVLWTKSIILRDYTLYSEAAECLDLFAQIMEQEDPNVYEYLNGAIAMILEHEATGLDYGVLVTGYADVPHELLRIGDIIIALNGEPCRTNTQYAAMKAELTQPEYTVTVLRYNGEYLEQLELELNTGMPLIGIASLGLE